MNLDLEVILHAHNKQPNKYILYAVLVSFCIFFLNFDIIYLFCVCGGEWGHYRHVEVRGQLAGVISVLLPWDWALIFRHGNMYLYLLRHLTTPF